MKFTVMVQGGNKQAYVGEYKITEAGVLSIVPTTGNPISYSPAYWVSVEITEAPERKARSGQAVFSS